MEMQRGEALPQLIMDYVHQSENGIAVLDADDRFVFHNDAFARMFGFGGQSMVGRLHDDMLIWQYENRRGINIEKPSLQAWLDHVHARHRSAPFRNFEIDLIDGRWILLSVQVHPNGEAVMFCSDITRQKTTERELAEARAEVERLAMTDELTGLPNRRHFLQRLDAEVARARRYRRPMCLAMLDLDHFKQVNDRYGHAAGDEVLRHFAGFVRGSLRASDVVGRLGGEEFAVLMPETPLENGAYVLRRVADLLADARVDAVEAGFAYTFSAGMASLPLTEEGANGQTLLAGADQAMYRAKSAGRNRIGFA